MIHTLTPTHIKSKEMKFVLARSQGSEVFKIWERKRF